MTESMDQPVPKAPPARPSAAPAWETRELGNPHSHEKKADKVRGMFAAIAGSYDLNNRLHSFGRDQAWRRYAVRAADVKATDVVLDVACGTGDLTRAFAQARPQPPARVIGLDFTQEMLDVAEKKRRELLTCGETLRQVAERVNYMPGDAQRLPQADASVDVVSIAFGIRNVGDPAAAVKEFYRVLKPGGRLIILEFDRPKMPVIRQLSDWYTGWLMPRTATLISGDRSGAYRYLPRSVETFMDSEKLSTLLGATGFVRRTATPLTLGVCVCHRAEKPRA